MPPFWGGVLRQNLVDLQKFFKSLQLVFHDLGIMNQYQCVDLSLRHKVCPNRCLAESRGGAEHTCVLRQHCSGILLMKQHWRFCGFLHIFRFRKHAQLAVCAPKRDLFFHKVCADFLHRF